MYCPQCSQQQVSNDIRFCSRCGFNLGVVSQLLTGSGQIQTGTPRGGSLSRFTKGKAPIGAKMMFFGVTLVPVAMIMSIVFDSPGPLAAPFLLFLAGLTQVLYVWLFGSKEPTVVPGRPSLSWEDNRPLDLPNAAQARLGAQRHSTSEIVAPPSVTEHTTKLLDS